MTNYQKRRDDKGACFIMDNYWADPDQHAAIAGFKSGYDQGYADALADVQPLVEALIESDRYSMHRESCSLGPHDDACTCHVGKVREALTHFKTLGGKGE